MLLVALRIYAVVAVVFLGLDFLWLGVVAKDHYRLLLGDLMRDKPIWPAALAFYALYVLGVLVFVVMPGLGQNSWLSVFLHGALYGLICYATFDLTALALLRGFPAGIVATDLCWGTVLTGTVSTVGWLAGRWFGGAAS